MSRELGFSSTLTSLWFRLISVAIVALVFVEVLVLAPGKVQAWTFYLSTPEVVFEVVVRLVAAALAGLVLGTICAAVIAPVLWYFKEVRERVVDWATKTAVVVVVFLVSWDAMEILIKSSYQWSSRGPKFYLALRVAYFLAFSVALLIPRTRKEVVTSLDGLLGEKMTRRVAVATVVGTAAVMATEFVLAKTARLATTPRAQSGPNPTSCSSHSMH